MPLFRKLTSTTALLAVFASPAFADLTAEQVLDDQLRQMQYYGLEARVDGQSRSGDTLTVDSLVATIAVPDGSMEITVGGAMFRELGDGTVEITYPDEIPFAISGTSAEGEPFDLEASIRQTNTRTVASGIPEELRYDFASDSFVVTDLRIMTPGDAEMPDMDVDITLTGLTGFMEFVGGGTVRDYVADFSFAGMTGSAAGTPPEGEEGSFEVKFDATDLKVTYDGKVAPQEPMSTPGEAILAGNVTRGTGTHGPITYSIIGDGPQGNFEVATAAASGDLEFSMDENGLDYGGTSRDVTLTMGGSVMPLPPLTFRMAESGGRLLMPLIPSEDSQDFALVMNFDGLEIDQMLWNMIDPVGQIPRDPATLVVDLGGEVVMTEDVFDPEVAETMTAPPGQINAVDINSIVLRLAGAELTGDGAFTFNNETGMPVPAGTLNMMLKGGNGLLDTLVGMGLVPEEQAMMARMFTGMFARPGTGPDTLVSTIEVQEDGAVLANGQRVR